MRKEFERIFRLRSFLLFLVTATAFAALTLWAAAGRYLPGEDQLLIAVVSHRLWALDLPMQVLSTLGSTSVVFPLWFLVLLGLVFRRQIHGLLALLPVPLGYVLGTLLKSLIARPGLSDLGVDSLHDLSLTHYLEGSLHHQLQTLHSQGASVPGAPPSVFTEAVTRVLETSYPSGHALLAVLFYGTLALLIWQNGRAGWLRRLMASLFVILVLLISGARVYNGAHLPSDVLGAWLLGVLLLYATHRFVAHLAIPIPWDNQVFLPQISND